MRTGWRDHHERFDRPRRDCDGRDRLGSRQRTANALAIFAGSQNRRLRRHQSTFDRLKAPEHGRSPKRERKWAVGFTATFWNAALLHRFDKAKGATVSVKCELKLVLF